MRRSDAHHDPRHTAVPGGLVAVLAVVLFVLAFPTGAAATPAAHEPRSAASVCDGPPAAPEQALHQLAGPPTGAAGRVVTPGGPLLGPAPLPAARCDTRPAVLPGFAAFTSGVPVRVLFCTWLN